MTSKPRNKPSWLGLYLWSGAALIAALVVFALCAIVDSQNVIEVRVNSSDREGKVANTELTCYFVEPNFQLRWIHSVEKQWWEEQYIRKSEGLLLTTTYFQAFGAGTPSTEVLAKVQKPGYIGYQINQKLPALNWVVSRLTQGEIDYGGNRILIHKLVPDYSEVTITPRAYNLIDRWKKDLCHDLPREGSQ